MKKLTLDAEARIVAFSLSEPQKKWLKSLPVEPGHYLVGATKSIKGRPLRTLREIGLLDEQFTWASGVGPDVGLSDFGRAVVRVI